MTIATGVARRLKYKVEATWGTIPSASAAQALRRKSTTLSLEKDIYQSEEIRSDYQRADARHGMRRVAGTISGELSAGTYKDFMAAALRQAFASVTAASSLSLTIAGTGPTYTITRGSGSWLSDGFKVGNVIRLSVGSLNAANINKNLFITSIGSATVLTVIPLNGVAMAAEGPIATCTATVIGKKTFVPSSGHTDLSYSIEDWSADVSLSHVYNGCKINGMGIACPSSGLGNVDFDFLGKDITTSASEYFTTPTAETTTGILAACNGIVVAQGSVIGYITGINAKLNGGMSGEGVIGSNVFADITEGRVEVDGDATVLLTDATFRDYFINETEVGLYLAMSATPAATADFIAFSWPRVKLGGAKPSDGEKSIVLSCPFTALRNTAGGSGTATEDTTMAVQDSQA